MDAHNTAYRRAAIVVASLDRASADSLLERMPEERARAIRDEIMRLDELPTPERQATIDAFLVTQHTDANPDLSIDSVMIATAATEELTPDQSGENAVEQTNTITELLNHDDESIASEILHERTSVIAALLSFVPGKRGAAILRLLPSERQAQIVRCLNAGVAPGGVAISLIAEQICRPTSGNRWNPTFGNATSRRIASDL